MAARSSRSRRLPALLLAALGVVYGDIGTSPLYAMRECFHGPHAVGPSPANVLGVLSLVIWSLILVVTLKYLVVVLRADHDGEGGILALLTLVAPPWENHDHARPGRSALFLLGIFGAALLYGDGMITPAISVLGAVEGLAVATPALEEYVVPIAIAVLLALFLFQARGTERVGAAFGPVMVAWFSCLALLGLGRIVANPEVLLAFDPRPGLAFLLETGWPGFLVLGAVFLVVTGGEALYADLGHFGRAPIRRAWFGLVLPALLANYLGQGALLLADPEAAASPFYHMAPRWALYPLVGLATAATVIASQAVITGVFSLTWQAIQLDCLPRMRVRHTSEESIGQIYVPGMNALLCVATILLAAGFGSSSALAAAYGVAVSTTMAITTILAFSVMRRRWRWSLPAALVASGAFLAIDLAFLGANAVKIPQGGWFPLGVAAAIVAVMTTWRSGRRLLAQRLRDRGMSWPDLSRALAEDPPVRVPGAAVYMTGNPYVVPPALVRVLRSFKVLPEAVLIVRVDRARSPHVPRSDRLRLEDLGHGVRRATLCYGFADDADVPRDLAGAPDLDLDPRTVTYVMGQEIVLATDRPGMAPWRERLFARLSRNALRANRFFRIPSDRVLEIGAEIEI